MSVNLIILIDFWLFHFWNISLVLTRQRRWFVREKMNFNDGHFMFVRRFPKLLFSFNSFFHLRCFHADDDVIWKCWKENSPKIIFGKKSLAFCARFALLLRYSAICFIFFSLMTARKMIIHGLNHISLDSSGVSRHHQSVPITRQQQTLN